MNPHKNYKFFTLSIYSFLIFPMEATNEKLLKSHPPSSPSARRSRVDDGFREKALEICSAFLFGYRNELRQQSRKAFGPGFPFAPQNLLVNGYLIALFMRTNAILIKLSTVEFQFLFSLSISVLLQNFLLIVQMFLIGSNRKRNFFAFNLIFFIKSFVP